MIERPRDSEVRRKPTAPSPFMPVIVETMGAMQNAWARAKAHLGLLADAAGKDPEEHVLCLNDRLGPHGETITEAWIARKEDVFPERRAITAVLTAPAPCYPLARMTFADPRTGAFVWRVEIVEKDPTPAFRQEYLGEFLPAPEPEPPPLCGVCGLGVPEGATVHLHCAASRRPAVATVPRPLTHITRLSPGSIRSLCGHASLTKGGWLVSLAGARNEAEWNRDDAALCAECCRRVPLAERAG